MSALIADTPPPVSEQPPAPVAAAPDAGMAACANCGAPLAPGQDWCLQCGAAAGPLTGQALWRTPLLVAAATVLLVLGAAAAGVAALSHKQRTAAVVTSTVAQAPAPAPTTPAGIPTTPVTPPSTAAKPPQIPLKAVTPPATTPTTPTETTQQTTPKEKPATGNTGGAGSETEAEPILLDTNAAQTYNPYAYPEAWFGDPSLAIDGDTSTGWTAQVNPATAPRMAEGVLLDLKTAQKVSAVKLVTSTPGMAIQIYGANGATVPASITDKGWTSLTRQLTIHKRHVKLKLRDRTKSWRWIAVWINRAGEASLRTPEAPGRVTVNEVELLPAP